MAWYLYEFGNSAYASVVLLAVYSAYFQKQVVGGAESSRLWSLTVSISMIIVASVTRTRINGAVIPPYDDAQ